MVNFQFELNSDPILLEDIDNSFRAVFDLETFSIRVDRSKIQNLDELFKEEFVPVKQLSFNIGLNSNSSVTNYDFIKEFNLQTFNIQLDKSKVVNDLIFEDYFKVEEEVVQIVEEPIIEIPKIDIFQFHLDESKSVSNFDFEDHFKIDHNFDYNIIDNLKRDLNSRKIITREEREEIPEIEPEISSIEEDKKESVSIEEELSNSKSVIKENSFYKIVEVNPDITQLPTEVDTSYKEEVEQQLSSMESKYEDLLQKTKDDYESKLGKMINDFSDFRNHITQQVTKMSFISSSSAGGGAVRILDMDDVDPSQLADGRTLIYNSEKRKFELEASRSQNAQVYEITSEILNDGYVDLNIEADPELYDLSTVELNGLVNYHNFHYTFISSTRVDISLLGSQVGDFIRVIYTRK
jgi:hypothetical protein